ncbi:unnamed protein product [Phytomonas sp. Hart1]|nr:unnamed protein product [Phytomonas sp. Hart1]|eukprot:CCW70962.1 unnamed protein product [Phytomonas sp. isolate Hart1]
MVLFSTYKAQRILPNSFLKQSVLRARAITEFYWHRPWNGTLMWLLPGDFRIWAVAIPIVYFFHRWHNDHVLDHDFCEKAMIKRWGGSLEEVRKLSPQDQLRVRSFIELEKLYASYGPKDLVVQPQGDSLPGKDYYQKDVHLNH